MVEEGRDPEGSFQPWLHKRDGGIYTFKDGENSRPQRNMVRGWRGEGEVAFQAEAPVSKGPGTGLCLVSFGNEKSCGPGAGHAWEVLRLAWWAGATVYGGP